MKRITVSLDDNIVKEIQKLRAEHLIDTNKDVSFSQMVNDCLNEYFSIKEEEIDDENEDIEENSEAKIEEEFKDEKDM